MNLNPAYKVMDPDLDSNITGLSEFSVKAGRDRALGIIVLITLTVDARDKWAPFQLLVMLCHTAKGPIRYSAPAFTGSYYESRP